METIDFFCRLGPDRQSLLFLESIPKIRPPVDQLLYATPYGAKNERTLERVAQNPGFAANAETIFPRSMEIVEVGSGNAEVGIK